MVILPVGLSETHFTMDHSHSASKSSLADKSLVFHSHFVFQDVS